MMSGSWYTGCCQILSCNCTKNQAEEYDLKPHKSCFTIFTNCVYSNIFCGCCGNGNESAHLSSPVEHNYNSMDSPIHRSNSNNFTSNPIMRTILSPRERIMERTRAVMNEQKAVVTHQPSVELSYDIYLDGDSSKEHTNIEQTNRVLHTMQQNAAQESGYGGLSRTESALVEYNIYCEDGDSNKAKENLQRTNSEFHHLQQADLNTMTRQNSAIVDYSVYLDDDVSSKEKHDLLRTNSEFSHMQRIANENYPVRQESASVDYSAYGDDDYSSKENRNLQNTNKELTQLQESNALHLTKQPSAELSSFDSVYSDKANKTMNEQDDSVASIFMRLSRDSAIL